jgi:ApaG domain
MARLLAVRALLTARRALVCKGRRSALCFSCCCCAGAPRFVYQSCMHQDEAEGTMEGHFTFVEGSISAPAGLECNVRCPKFALSVPQYIY